ncbi:MAG TPA: hypothetical protein VKR32_07335 [Puia sp.]|nr:hypothetical protein [Puia sp.]
MSNNLENLTPEELRRLLMEEIQNFTLSLDNNTPLLSLQEKRIHIRSLYERLDQEEKHQFEVLFGEKPLPHPLDASLE